jgi:HEAT repeat protein
MTVAAHRKLPKVIRTKLQRTVIKRLRALKLSHREQLIQLALDARSPIKRRSEAIYLLGLLSDLDKLGGQERAFVPLLIKVMKEDIPLIAWSAAVALAQIGDWSAVDKLRRIAKNNNAEETRRAAIYALGRLGDPRATPVLVRVLENPREPTRLRAEAAEALATCGYSSKRAIAALTRALRVRSVQIRFFSAYALGICARMGGPVGEQAVNGLQRLLKDASVLPQFGSVAKEAAKSFRAIEKSGAQPRRKILR